MGLGQDISQLFTKKSSQREILRKAIEESLSSGRFYRFTSRKRAFLFKKFHRLTRSVSRLKWQLAAAGSIAAVVTNSSDAIAQTGVGPFVQQSRAHNPLRYPMRESELKPTVVDLDNDGDFDIVVGEDYGPIRIYLNEGTPEEPGFTEFEALDQTLTPINQPGGAPAFADLNGDGKLDMVFGIHEQSSADRIQYWVGNGGIPGNDENPLFFTRQSDEAWDADAKTGNPFYGLNASTVGYNLTVAFVNFDGDSDIDVLIGHNYQYTGPGSISVNYYINDGQSNFTPSSINLLDPADDPIFLNSDRVTPQLGDIDGDGNADIVLGRDDGDFLFLRGDGVGNFTEQTGPWDENAKTGNPFNGIDYGDQSAPAFVDLDNDGDLDLIMGVKEPKYNNSPLFYFENLGNAVFEQKTQLENPFDGIYTGYDAIPNFIDIDGDGDMDAALGGKYAGGNDTPNDRFTLFENIGGKFGPRLDDDLEGIADFADDEGFAAVFVNLDGDADVEVAVATYTSEIQYFDKVDGDYVEVTGAASPFNGLTFGNDLKLTFGDIDNDGDQDFFIGGDLDDPYSGKIRYFKNIGSASTATFEGQTGVDNPLDAVTSTKDLIPKLADVDNDGDLDVLITEDGVVEIGMQVTFYENTGTASNPVFTLRTSHPFQGLSLPYRPSLGFVDLDQDGDHDFFAGGEGKFEYYVNSNPAPVTTTSTSELSYEFGTGPIVVDANLTLADGDTDEIVMATIAIQNYQPGDELLAFTTQAPITGEFDEDTGVLTLTGKASLSAYQDILRTVTYEYSGTDPGGRKVSSGKVKSISRIIDFLVYDEDLTTPNSSSRAIKVASPPATNQPPVITPSPLTTAFKGQVSLDLLTIVSDPDNNLDPDSFVISEQPISGVPATITNTILNIDYSNSGFTGQDNLKIMVSDLLGSQSTEATISIQVEDEVVSGDIIVRNGISPNGDGLNDYFKIDNITTLAPENKVEIFTRWGDKVFEIENYNNQDRRFEGKSDGGKALSSGVYFYKIEFKDGRKELTGYITLKR